MRLTLRNYIDLLLSILLDTELAHSLMPSGRVKNGLAQEFTISVATEIVTGGAGVM